MERKRIKNLTDVQNPKYKYLFEAVSNLIRAYKNHQKSPFQTDDVRFEQLYQQERDLYIPDFKFLKQVFDNAKKNRSIKAAVYGYVHFTWAEKEGFTELFNCLHQAFIDYDSEYLRPYFFLL